MATTNAAKSFEARELHLKTVTVFTDRAEVVRVFSVDLEEGLTDVIVNVSVSSQSYHLLIIYVLERGRYAGQ